MQKLKKTIICILLLIIILGIGLGIILFVNNKQEEEEKGQIVEQFVDESIDYNNVKKEKIVSNIQFYSIKDCVQNYLEVLNINSPNYYGKDATGQNVKVIEDDIIKQNIYDLLSEKYIKENNISKENLYDYVEEINESLKFVPRDMYVLVGETTNKYLVSGFIQDMAYKKKKDICIFVNADKRNSTFSIEPINNKNINIDDIIIENENEPIERNSNNKYQNPKVTEEYLAQQYFNTYKQIVLGEPKLAYEYMNEDYRTKRFGNYENFEKYINQYREKIVNWGLTKFLVNQKGMNSEYICLDSVGNYYIFKEKESLKYEVFLDNYTIESEDFINKYNNSDDKTKAGMNVEKLFQALNSKDYSYIYTHLAESFKARNFQTQEKLEEFIAENLFDNNDKEYLEYKQQGNVHIFKVKLLNKGKDNEQKNMTVMVQLNEGTDFVMSLSIEE